MDRRDFLRIVVVASAGALPLSRLALGRPVSFLHTATGDYWSVDDPVAWSLENAQQPILERASKGLAKLSTSDPTRIIRLVTRRCHLNLIEVEADRVQVHHWGKLGFNDLRSFFKKHGLAHPHIEVVLLDRKRETSTAKTGDFFHYGEPIQDGWPLQSFVSKWERRYVVEADDSMGAGGTWSAFAWKSVRIGQIPWAALKSAWRRMSPFPCPNCNLPTILTNFGFVQAGMCNRVALFSHVCHRCKRSFREETIYGPMVMEWVVANVEPEFWPDFDTIWGKHVAFDPNFAGLGDVDIKIEGLPG